MKVKSSQYLKEIKPQLQKLLSALLEEYEYASVLAEDSVAKRYAVSKTGVNITEDGRLCRRGVVVKVYDGNGYAEYAFNKVNEEELALAVKTLRESIVPLSEKLPDGVSASKYKKLADDSCTFHESTEYEIHPEEYGEEKLVALLTEISKEGRAMDERVLNCGASFAWQQYSKLFLSEHRDMEQDVLWASGGINANVANGEKVEFSFKGYSNLGGAELLGKMKEGLSGVVNTALELLHSEPMIPGEYDCICTPEVTGMIVHEAFGHGVEMDMFVKKRALAERFVGIMWHLSWLQCMTVRQQQRKQQPISLMMKACWLRIRL